MFITRIFSYLLISVVLLHGAICLLTGSIYPKLCVLLGMLFVFLFFSREMKETPKEKLCQSLLFLAALLTVYSLSHFTAVPFSNLWDGANHTFLIRYLETNLQPPQGVAPLGLSWGGDLRGYPWSLHAVIVSVGQIFNVDPIWCIQPLLALSIASFVVLVFSLNQAPLALIINKQAVAQECDPTVKIATLCAVGSQSFATARGQILKMVGFLQSTLVLRVVPALLSLLLSIPLLTTNSWTLVAGLLFMLESIHAWDRQRRISFMFSSGATFLLHPMLGAILLGSTGLFSIVHDRRTFSKIEFLIPCCMFSLWIAFSPVHQNYERLVLKDGGRIVFHSFYPLLFIIWSVHTFFCRLSSQSLLIYIAGTAILTGVVISFIGATPYWTSRLSFIASIFLIFQMWLFPISKKPLYIGCALIVSLFFIKNIRYLPKKFPLSFESQILAKRDALKKLCSDNTIFFLTDPYTASWTEALLYPERVSLPADMQEIAMKCQRSVCIEPFLKWIAKYGKPNDCIVAANGQFEVKEFDMTDAELELGSLNLVRVKKIHS